METLENYLASDYLAEDQEIKAIDRTLSGVATTFSEIFREAQWPYEFVTDNTEIPQPIESQGTQAMVLTAVGRMVGHCGVTRGTFTSLEGGSVKKLKENWTKGLKFLIKALKKSGKVHSSSFGTNNPLTLSHISELHHYMSSTQFRIERNVLAKTLADAKCALQKLLENKSLDDLLKPTSTATYYKNAFVPLRALRAAADLGIESKFWIKHKNFFESTLHDHLSFSSIPDSRFDPAELLFCMEGLLLCAPEAVDGSLFKRVLEVLDDKQNTSAHWRPNKPFLADPKGAITLPVSVEGANSLMRSTAIMDGDLYYDTFTAKSLPLVRRFWHWLLARSVHFDFGGKPCIGWHSEHVNSPNLIHIWDTSQVAEFMMSLRVMLERHIELSPNLGDKRGQAAAV